MTLKKQQGLNEISRYNLYTTAAIQGAPAAGFSTGQAIAIASLAARWTSIVGPRVITGAVFGATLE